MHSELWLLVSAILVIIGLAASQDLLLIVGTLVILITLVARLWDRFAFRDVSYSRVISRNRAFIGDTLEYSVTLTNEKLLPLIWVDLQDRFPDGLELPGASLKGSAAEATRNHGITTSLLPYQKVTWKYNLQCKARGYHRIGPVRLRSGDMFGFSSAETRFQGLDHLLVYPRVVDLARLVFPAEHPLGETKGRRPVTQDTTRVVGQRDYRPTDPLKHIDWKATARLNSLQTKVFEPVVSLNVLFAMNGSTSEYAWQGSNRRLFERAITVTASAANDAAKRGYTFGMISNAVASYSGKWLSIPLGASPNQLPLVLESLAMAAPYVVTSISNVLRAERDSLPPGTTVVLVTPVVTAGLIEDMDEIKARGYRAIVIYAGDGEPELEWPGVAVYPVGSALDLLEEHARELED